MASASETVRHFASYQPERVAVRLDGTDTTYGALDEIADRIATRLVAELPPRSAIAVQAHGSLAVIQVTLGVRRAGMILVPFDPTSPPHRVREMVLDSEARLLLLESTEEWEADGVAQPACPIQSIHDFGADIEPHLGIDVHLQLDDLHLLAYTSGSVGTPKAVMLGEIVTPAVMDAAERFLPASDRGWVALSAGSLGASIHLLTLGLAFGRMVLPVEVRRVGFATMADLIDSEEAEALLMVPTVLRFWLPGLEPGRCFPSLTCVAAFGESMTGEDHNSISARLSPSATILNAYASTESGFATFFARSASERADPGPLPVGSAGGGVELTIVDETGEPLLAGEEGEIVVTSHSTALGYWRRPELTNATFNQLSDGRRAVRTGDRGRLAEDGTLLHLGRVDHVVKVSGNRVDLGDVEHALRGLPWVQHAAVAPRVDEQSTTTLHAYIVLLPETADIPQVVLRAELSRRLPSWMLPVSITTLASLPLLSNGKIDRRSLPDPQPIAAGNSKRAPAARERELLEIWKEALGRNDIGLDDDFFALGGDSLKAATIMAELDRRYGIIGPVTALLEAPTIAALAATLGAEFDEHSLVPVRVTGDEAPLIVVHDLHGDPFFARGLAQHLPANLPLYALQAPLADEGECLKDATLEQLATRYVNAVLTVQPDGPYRLFGFSAGGVIAYEMALQLEARGQTVEILILGDTPAPGAMNVVAAAPTAVRVSARLREIRAAGLRGGPLLAGTLVVNEVRSRSNRLKQRRVQAAAGVAPGRESPERRAQRMSRAVGRLLLEYRSSASVGAPSSGAASTGASSSGSATAPALPSAAIATLG